MNYLSISGLVLDVAGVLMLGFDLVRVQRKLRGDADERLATLNEIAESAGGLDSFLKSISGDWREYDREEGQYIPRYGTFDHQAAASSLDEIKDSINGLADNLQTVATIMVNTVESDRKTASMSLWVTYGGLVFIVVGFALQAAAYL